VSAGAVDHGPTQSRQRAHLDQSHRLGGHPQPRRDLAQRLGGVSVETVAARDHQPGALRQPVDGTTHPLGCVAPPQGMMRIVRLGRRQQIDQHEVAVLRDRGRE